MDRKGRRVFCAKFDRDPKWGHRHNTATGSSIATKVSTWDDDESIHLVSRFYSEDDRKYSEYSDEDDAIYKSYTSIEDN